MAFAPPTKTKMSATNMAKSTWTPMGNTEANSQVFDERKALINKWFEKWNEKQKRVIVDDIIKQLSEKHLALLNVQMLQKFPQEKHDFTRRLPRVLTLYVFSFLDPRTLCRCAQVSWYWKYLTEMDCIWRPKCLKFGWYPTEQASPYEEAVWKRFYVNTIFELNYAKAKASDDAQHAIGDKTDRTVVPNSPRSNRSRISSARSHASATSGIPNGPKVVSTKHPLPRPKWEPPPWRGSDKKPTDTLRYNYLDNSAAERRKKRSQHEKENHERNSPRPRTASGSLILSARSVDLKTQPNKSSRTPVIKQSLNDPHRSKVAQSVDSTKSRHPPMASEQNMLSSSVAKFASDDSVVLRSAELNGTKQSYNLDGTMNSMTLNASTYHVKVPGLQTTDFRGTLNTSSMKIVPDISTATIHDAGIRPKPITKTPEKSNEATMNIRNIAKSTDYQTRNATDSGGKITPLQGSPWKPPENLSDDD